MCENSIARNGDVGGAGKGDAAAAAVSLLLLRVKSENRRVPTTTTDRESMGSQVTSPAHRTPLEDGCTCMRAIAYICNIYARMCTDGFQIYPYSSTVSRLRGKTTRAEVRIIWVMI